MAPLQNVPETEVSLEACADYWARILQGIRAEAAEVPRDSYMEVRYEDLILYPVRELRKVAAFLNVSTPWKWLIKAALIPRPTEPIKWAERLRKPDIRAISPRIAGTLQHYGYDCYNKRHLLKVYPKVLLNQCFFSLIKGATTLKKQICKFQSSRKVGP